ncbi:hypothetical protein J6590_028188 [Homalodisca vitripennis]|nr:hypothetical protein J6590_028188 [Homalodisca vitripennis]
MLCLVTSFKTLCTSGSDLVQLILYCVLAESDNESVPPTPHKIKPTRVSVKTLEQIKLDKIQAESAAYYSLPSSSFLPGGKDLSFHVMSLEEIRSRKRKVDDGPLQPDSTTMKKEEDEVEAKVKNAIEEHRTKKPIRLRRGFKMPSDSEDHPRARSKRVKMMDNTIVSSTNSEASVVPDDPVTYSLNVKDVPMKTEDDLLKDIDALLAG